MHPSRSTCRDLTGRLSLFLFFNRTPVFPTPKEADMDDSYLSQAELKALLNKQHLPSGEEGGGLFQSALSFLEWVEFNNSSKDLILIHGEKFQILFANKAYLEKAHKTLEEIKGKPYWTVYPKLDGPLSTSLEGYITGLEQEERVSGADGLIYRARVFPRRIRGMFQLSILIMENISKQITYENKLILSTRILEYSREAIIVTDSSNRIQSVNPAFSKITGYDPADVVGEDPRILKSDLHPPEFYKDMWLTVLSKGHWEGEVINRKKNGELFTSWLSITSLMTGGIIDHYVGILDDISEKKIREEQLTRLAYQDPLTGLANRYLLLERIPQILAFCKRRNMKAAVLAIDIDRFKPVNDTYGHMVGDKLLQILAKRLALGIRGEDIVARMGGDEFVLIVNAITNAEDAARVAEKIQVLLSQPMEIDGHEITQSASIGIALYPDDGEDPEDLMRNADKALYFSKRKGRNNYHFF